MPFMYAGVGHGAVSSGRVGANLNQRRDDGAVAELEAEKVLVLRVELLQPLRLERAAKVPAARLGLMSGPSAREVLLSCSSVEIVSCPCAGTFYSSPDGVARPLEDDAVAQLRRPPRAKLAVFVQQPALALLKVSVCHGLRWGPRQRLVSGHGGVACCDGAAGGGAHAQRPIRPNTKRQTPCSPGATPFFWH